MATGAYANIDGVWKKIIAGFVNIDGSWKKLKAIFENINGTWKMSWVSYIGRLYIAEYPDSSGSSKIHELNYDTFAIIKSATHPDPRLTGVGGIQGRLFTSDTGWGNLRELHPDTFATLGGPLNSPRGEPTGIGGTQTRLYNSELPDKPGDRAYIHELNPNTLGSIRSHSTTQFQHLAGVGGDNTHLFAVGIRIGSTTDEIYEINVDTLAIIRSVTSSIQGLSEIGGIQNRIYVSSKEASAQSRIYELNAVNLSVIKTSNVINLNIVGVGGIK